MGRLMGFSPNFNLKPVLGSETVGESRNQRRFGASKKTLSLPPLLLSLSKIKVTLPPLCSAEFGMAPLADENSVNRLWRPCCIFYIFDPGFGFREQNSIRIHLAYDVDFILLHSVIIHATLLLTTNPLSPGAYE